jgi:hypothetical protein
MHETVVCSRSDFPAKVRAFADRAAEAGQYASRLCMSYRLVLFPVSAP